MKSDLFVKKLIVFLLFNSFVFAQSFEGIEIILSSSSGKSVVLNKGRLHGLKEGDRASFLVHKGTMDNPKLEKVAEGEVIRALDNQSYWFLRKVFNPGRIRNSQKLSMQLRSKQLEGQRRFKVLNRKRIYTRSSKNNDIDFENDIGVPKQLVIENDNFVESKKIVQTKLSKDHDIEIHEFDTWSKRNGLTKVDDFMKSFERKYVNENFAQKEITDDEVNKIRNTIYRAQLDGFIAKVNSLQYGLKGLYHDQRKDKDIKAIKARTDILNVYDEAREEKRRKRILGVSTSKKFARDGKLWSSDFTDESLRNYMINSGIEEEEMRQYKSLTQKTGNELSFRVSSALVGHSTSEDSNHQNKGYSLSIGYEYHLMRTSMALSRLSFEIFGQQSVENIDIGGINGRFTSGSFGGQLLYYFYNNPAIISQWAWYGGLGIRRGSADVTSVDLSTDYEYQVTGLPIWSIGTKYRFRSGDSFEDDIPVGAGLNIRLSGERMNLTSVTTNNDNVQTNIIINDVKLTIGLSVYF